MRGDAQPFAARHLHPGICDRTRTSSALPVAFGQWYRRVSGSPFPNEALLPATPAGSSCAERPHSEDQPRSSSEVGRF
jgi:hypothetical protein